MSEPCDVAPCVSAVLLLCGRVVESCTRISSKEETPMEESERWVPAAPSSRPRGTRCAANKQRTHTTNYPHYTEWDYRDVRPRPSANDVDQQVRACLALAIVSGDRVWRLCALIAHPILTVVTDVLISW